MLHDWLDWKAAYYSIERGAHAAYHGQPIRINLAEHEMYVRALVYIQWIR
jgi:hypothetical protein